MNRWTRLLVSFLFASALLASCGSCGGRQGIEEEGGGDTAVPASPDDWVAFLTMEIMLTKGYEIMSSAGGVVISQHIVASEETLRTTAGISIVTAAHFCTDFISPLATPIFAYNSRGQEFEALPLVVDVDADLCLIVAIGDWGGEALTQLVDPNTIPDYARIENYGNPYGRFQGEDGEREGEPRERFVTFRNEGFFAGIWSDYFFAHNITSESGQSGSAILYEGSLLGIVMARDRRSPHIGYAVRGDVVYRFLSDNGYDEVYLLTAPFD